MASFLLWMKLSLLFGSLTLGPSASGWPTSEKKRTPASLKYLLTELLCARAGGPETPTAPSLLETRLLVSSKELFQVRPIFQLLR